jgi:type I site-specific restriction-modification system R (restriction) subunit
MDRINQLIRNIEEAKEEIQKQKENLEAEKKEWEVEKKEWEAEKKEWGAMANKINEAHIPNRIKYANNFIIQQISIMLANHWYRLDIGGALFTTTLTTITSIKGTYFEAMFSGVLST